MKLAHKNEFASQGKNPNFQIEEFFLRKVVRIPMIKRLGATAVGSIRTGWPDCYKTGHGGRHYHLLHQETRRMAQDRGVDDYQKNHLLECEWSPCCA